MRYNIIAALNKNELFAPFIFEGYLNKIIYEIYLERVLVPSLKPGMVLVIDNASFHKSKKITNLVESVGCKVIFLPAYSPDLNPIEHYWAAIKSTIRKTAQKAHGDFYQAAIQTLNFMCTA